MSDQAEREMTLDEFVGRLHPGHFARRELIALRARIRTLSDREKVLVAVLDCAEARINELRAQTQVLLGIIRAAVADHDRDRSESDLTWDWLDEARAALSEKGASEENTPATPTDMNVCGYENLLYEFAGWLTTSKRRLVLSATDDAGPAAEAVGEFIREYLHRPFYEYAVPALTAARQQGIHEGRQQVAAAIRKMEKP